MLEISLLPESPQMKPERHRRIVEAVEADGDVTVSTLAVSLGVSEMTVRRDLQELEEAGLLRRVHGGATKHLGRAYAPPFGTRELQAPEQKQALGRAAAELVGDGDAIGLDVGSTVLAMVPFLASRADNLTVVTASLRVAVEIAGRLTPRQRLRLVATGGVLHPEELSLTGQMATDAFRSVRLDTAFVGVGGLDPQEGATEFDLEDAQVKRGMIASARRVVVLADSTKLGRVCFAAVCPTSRIDVLVTDEAADPDILERIRATGIEVAVAGT